MILLLNKAHYSQVCLMSEKIFFNGAAICNHERNVNLWILDVESSSNGGNT